ncbi:MAG TPA: SRPBCC family protein [Allosphingosinicella sp.]|nr:SRPBCC family protein [Allosphingosinicella sp.]
MTKIVLALLILLLPATVMGQDVAISDRREADGTLTLSHEVVIAAPAAEIWAAIASPEGWRTWAVPVSWVAADDPDSIESSYDPAARPGDPTIIRQHFLARLPGRLLVFRTTRAPQGFPHFETYARVTSFFEVEPVDATHSRIRLTGAGYADNEAGRTLLGFFRDGNRVSLERLRDRFVSGRGIGRRGARKWGHVKWGHVLFREKVRVPSGASGLPHQGHRLGLFRTG